MSCRVLSVPQIGPVSRAHRPCRGAAVKRWSGFCDVGCVTSLQSFARAPNFRHFCLWTPLCAEAKEESRPAGYAGFGPKWRNGRRRGFKIPRRKACRFESGLGYHIVFTMFFHPFMCDVGSVLKRCFVTTPTGHSHSLVSFPVRLAVIRGVSAQRGSAFCDSLSSDRRRPSPRFGLSPPGSRRRCSQPRPVG
jgi:hypothetical protein